MTSSSASVSQTKSEILVFADQVITGTQNGQNCLTIQIPQVLKAKDSTLFARKILLFMKIVNLPKLSIEFEEIDWRTCAQVIFQEALRNRVTENNYPVGKITFHGSNCQCH